MKAYKVLYEGASAEIVEKKSRFIADVKPVDPEEILGLQASLFCVHYR